jgi:hypothetical protein
MHAQVPSIGESAATRSEPSNTRHTRPAPHRTPRPRAPPQTPQAARTSELQSRQIQRQCACQRLHTRSTDLVPCKPRAAEPQPPPSAQCTHWLPSQGDPPPEGPKPSTSHHTQRALHPMPRPRVTAQKRRPHVPLSQSSVRLGGSARASASIPTAPIWFPASREQPSFKHKPKHDVCAASSRGSTTTQSTTLAPSQGDPPSQGPMPALRTACDPHCTTRAQTESDSTGADCTYCRD